MIVDWIRVKDRLPDIDVTVLVDGGIAKWNGESWYSLTGCEYPGRPIHWEVTHWMPLPEPPGVKEE